MLVQNFQTSGKLTRFVLVILSAIYLLAACSPTAPGSNPDSHSTEVSWSITLNISGGFAGIMQTISLDQTGKALLVDNKLKSKVEKQVTKQELQTYVKLVKNLPDIPDTKAKPGQCRDCFNYSLVAIYAETQKRRVVDSMAITESDAKELISKLTMLAKEMKNSN